MSLAAGTMAAMTSRRAFASRRHWPRVFGALAVTGVVAAGCALDPGPQIPRHDPPAPGPPVPAIDVDAPGRTSAQLADWAGEVSAQTDIPADALAAYGHAAAVMERARPECALAWTTLAGIGGVESAHGRHGGARIDEEGRVVPEVIGIPLDGSPGVALIEDTDGGRVDGDPVYDRAVGPMQFLPETWAHWGTDADGDGLADPHSIDDAALTAARYLCAADRRLDLPEGWGAALWSYNQSTEYAGEVSYRANAYAIGARP